jgi:hypothetical protein
MTKKAMERLEAFLTPLDQASEDRWFTAMKKRTLEYPLTPAQEEAAGLHPLWPQRVYTPQEEERYSRHATALAEVDAKRVAWSNAKNALLAAQEAGVRYDGAGDRCKGRA